MKNNLFTNLLLGVILGGLFGIVFQDKALYLEPLGQLFLNAIKMIAAPLIFVSLVATMASFPMERN